MEKKIVLWIVLLLLNVLTLTSNIQLVTALDEPVPQLYSPFAFEITGDAEYAYIGFDLSPYIFKVRLENLTVEAVADLSEYFPLESEDIALSADEEKLFVCSAVWRKLLVLDTKTMSVMHTIDEIGGFGETMTRSLYGPFLITWDGGNTVKFVNMETYDVTEFTDDSIGFVHIQESRHDEDLWYVVSGDGRVGVYDHGAKSWSHLFSLPLHEVEEWICDLEVLPNEQKFYVATVGGWYPEYHAYGWLYSIDLTKEEVNVVPIDGGALCLEASGDSQSLYVGTLCPVPDINNILVVDTQSDNIKERVYLGYNKYGWHYTQLNRLQIDPLNSTLLYATSTDGNAFIKADLDSLSIMDALVFNKEVFKPRFFVRRPMQTAGYVLIRQSANAFELDLPNATIENIVKFPMIREDVNGYDVAIDDAGRLFIAQGETILELDVEDMKLLKSHPLPLNISGLWSFILSNDQKYLYSVWRDPLGEDDYQGTFLVIDTTDFQVKKRLKLEGGAFDEKPYELPDGSKIYALGGWDFGPIVINVIEKQNFTIQKTIKFEEPSLMGISAGPYHPFAYDSSSHTLFVGATNVVLAIDTDADVIKKVIYLGDVARAIGLEPWHFTYVNAVGLVHNPKENYLYIAHLDRSFISIYDMNNEKFLPQVIPLKGLFPSFLFSNDVHSKIYCLTWRSDSISVIDVETKGEEKVIDLHDNSWDKVPPVADAGADIQVAEDSVVSFNGSASHDNLWIMDYTWTFKEMEEVITLKGVNPSYRFKNPGLYFVSLNVTDAMKNYDTDAIEINVIDITEPVAKAGSDRAVKAGENIVFDASTSTDNVKITSYEWDLGDGTKRTFPIEIHTYMEPGIYEVTLTVRDGAGNLATDIVTVTVEEKPPEPSREKNEFPSWILTGGRWILIVLGISFMLGMTPYLLTRKSKRPKQTRK